MSYNTTAVFSLRIGRPDPTKVSQASVDAQSRIFWEYNQHRSPGDELEPEALDFLFALAADPTRFLQYGGNGAVLIWASVSKYLLSRGDSGPPLEHLSILSHLLLALAHLNVIDQDRRALLLCQGEDMHECVVFEFRLQRPSRPSVERAASAPTPTTVLVRSVRVPVSYDNPHGGDTIEEHEPGTLTTGFPMSYSDLYGNPEESR